MYQSKGESQFIFCTCSVILCAKCSFDVAFVNFLFLFCWMWNTIWLLETSKKSNLIKGKKKSISANIIVKYRNKKVYRWLNSSHTGTPPKVDYVESTT